MNNKFAGKVILVFISLFIVTSVLSRVFDTGYAQEVKEPVSVESQQVQEENTLVEATSSSSILSEDEKNIKRIDVFLGGQLKGQAMNIVKYSKQYNVNCRLIAAIAIHETGNGESVACKRYNNPGGLMGTNGLMKFKKLEYGIEYMCMNLRELYIDKGLTDIENIQKKYCPVGAKNDPTGLNKHWLPRVTELYNKITNEEA